MCAIDDLSERPIALAPKRCAGGPCSGICKRLGMVPPLAPAVDEDDEDILSQLPFKVDDEFAAEVLRPYRKNAVYLKSTEITQVRDKASKAEGTDQASLITAQGRFQIPESCYIDDTGHFNAVEFNICYNQLAYVAFGKCIEAGVFHQLRHDKHAIPSMPAFKHHQLKSMMIVSIESRYYKQLDSRDFTAELRLDKLSAVGDAWFLFTSITFSDRDGVKAKGSVVLAFSPSFNPVRH